MIDERIKNIFRVIFETDEIDINTTINDIDSWDSLFHIRLIAAIEKEFSVRFSFGEIIELTSISKIVENLRSKRILL